MLKMNKYMHATMCGTVQLCVLCVMDRHAYAIILYICLVDIFFADASDTSMLIC